MAAGLIPFIALSPPVASVLPFLPADLVANAALLQVRPVFAPRLCYWQVDRLTYDA